jgi:hypothetical protein
MREGYLDAMERNVIINFGQDCTRVNRCVDSKAMLDTYHIAFSGHTRDKKTLKRAWDNYKDTAAFNVFLKTIGKSK